MARSNGSMANAIMQGKVEGKRPQGRPAGQLLDATKEWIWLSSNEMWREPEDRVARRKRVSRVAPTDRIVYDIHDSIWHYKQLPCHQRRRHGQRNKSLLTCWRPVSVDRCPTCRGS